MVEAGPADGIHTHLAARLVGRGPDGWPLLALPLGGEAREPISILLREGPLAPPSIHFLEASTGREQHSLMGVASAKFADLDGDGLADLWGDFDGELRAFRGESPEAWRALGRFERTRRVAGSAFENRSNAGEDWFCDSARSGI